MPKAPDRRVAISRSVRRAMLAHARRERPRECCGLLVGDRDGVRYAVAMANIAPGNTRYRVDDRAHLELRRSLRTFAPALEILGVYHSHPAGSADVSPTDIAESMYPDWIYVIVGLEPRPAVRAFRIRKSAARELRIRWA
jgi:proteasome lid subunit RPN8/RPN11